MILDIPHVLNPDPQIEGEFGPRKYRGREDDTNRQMMIGQPCSMSANLLNADNLP